MSGRVSRRVVVSLSTVHRRADSVELAVGGLRSMADVRVHPAPDSGDPGPIWKWIAPQEIPAGCAVIVLDDDRVYTDARLMAIVEVLEAHGPGTIVQGADAVIDIGTTWSGRPCLRTTHATGAGQTTAIFQAYAGVGLHACDFTRLREYLLSHLSDDPVARVSDDYVVSRAARLLGLRAVVLPLPGPEILPAQHDEGALSRQRPGHGMRYRDLVRAEPFPWWAP